VLVEVRRLDQQRRDAARSSVLAGLGDDDDAAHLG